MPQVLTAPPATRRPAASLLRPRRFLWLTAALLPLCALLMLLLDQPLARFCHAQLRAAEPFFSAFTAATDRAYEVGMKTRLLHLPALLLTLGLLYAVGRWRLNQPRAAVFLVVLLTHLASVGTSNVLKGVVRRLRPEVLFSTGYPDLGFRYLHAAHADSFPSTHTATYFSLFVPLVLAFPRLRGPLLVLPVLIGLGRLVMGAHYLSDVLFSVWLVAAYTCLFGQLLRWPWLTGEEMPAALAS
ncbi:PAP2 superfamily protein [Hymenobacter daecheongensis DSM 21074]|uniref:PAP2 superfamily protein n=1 Tax=Hymenobacter daecheongensis DSM 21074 TaxID=1121955 RepID=A0A1M6LRG9_9BACT|nr:phosphatase PAP2 family protein [Hymenobacter daecheongensis]SHJ73761.1 PAP2 superfamily protein [Hymenobacter daecheongensis DSM 21074]